MSLSDHRIARSSLSNQVYDAIRQSIMTGSLRGRERLVVERLAQELGVSPTPIREALARLRQDGIVEEVAPGRLQVVPITRQYVLDTYWVRSALEGLAAELAAMRMSREDLAALELQVQAAADAIKRGAPGAYEEANQHLHWSIVLASGNHVLIRDLEAFQSHIGYIRDYFLHLTADRTDRLAQANVEHAQILESLATRDTVQARRQMELHIRNSAKRLGEVVEEADQLTSNGIAPRSHEPRPSWSS